MLAKPGLQEASRKGWNHHSSANSIEMSRVNPSCEQLGPPMFDLSTMEPVELAAHPSCLATPALLLQCEVRRQRRSGPGGQHRNKVETAVVLVHQPTGLRGEASERRSQAQNLKVAVRRLRIKLAIHFRSPHSGPSGGDRSPLWQSRVRGLKIAISPAHDDYPSLLAEALDVLSGCGFDTKLAGRSGRGSFEGVRLSRR